MYTLRRSTSDTSVITSPIAPRRSERLLLLRTKSQETGTTASPSEGKATKEGSTSKAVVTHHCGDSSKVTVKSKKAEDEGTTSSTRKTRDKQTSSKRSAKKSLSESDLTPKQLKRRRVVSPEDKQDLLKDKIQRPSRTTGPTSANQSLSGTKKDKSVSEPLLTSPKGKASGNSEDKGKKATSRENKISRKNKSTGTSTSTVTTRQLRKLKGRNITEMSSDE